VDDKDNQANQPSVSGAGDNPNKDNKITIDVNTGDLASNNPDTVSSDDSTENKIDSPVVSEPNDANNVTQEVNEALNTESSDDPAPVQPNQVPDEKDNIESNNLTPSVQPKISQVVDSPSELAQLKKRNKFLKAWLVIFLVIVVALISAGVVYFNLYNKNQSNTDELKAQNSQLQKQLVEQNNNANQQTINQLNQQITDQKNQIDELNKKIETQDALIADYKKTVDALVKACGDQCSAIVNPSQNIVE
jgi:uncharacterized protein HemX